eukprot:10751105-Karenia_brevis.AAC.1
MRQSLWRVPGGGRIPVHLIDVRPSITTDRVMWVDTAVMMVDCMTKHMKSDYMEKCLDTCSWNPEQPTEAKELKARKQLSRKNKKIEKPGVPPEA